MIDAICALQFLQCKLTLRKERGDKAHFFAFADTLTTKVRSACLRLTCLFVQSSSEFLAIFL